MLCLSLIYFCLNFCELIVLDTAVSDKLENRSFDKNRTPLICHISINGSSRLIASGWQVVDSGSSGTALARQR